MATENEWDMVGVSLGTSRGPSGQVRIMSAGRTLENATGEMHFAILRRGVDEEFFAIVRAGLYRDGDRWGDKHTSTDVPNAKQRKRTRNSL